MTTSDPGAGPDPEPPMRRASAVLALTALAAALLFLVVVSIRRWDVLLVSVVSLGVAVVAAWYVVSRRGSVRAAAAALGGHRARRLRRGDPREPERSGAGRRAGSRSASRQQQPATRSPRRRRPTTRGRAQGEERGPHHEPAVRREARSSGSGSSSSAGSGVSSRMSSPPARTCEPWPRPPSAAGADLLGMAGGDGSLAIVASVASRHDLPFVVVPAGTRNHFALDLGIDREDVPGAMEAFDDGVDTRVDLAEINGRVFVNNASMGVYAKVVQSADYRDAKVQTASALLPDMLGPGARPLDLHYRLPSGRGGRSGPAAAGVQQPLRPRAPARRRHARAPRRRRARGRLVAGRLGCGRGEAGSPWR